MHQRKVKWWLVISLIIAAGMFVAHPIGRRIVWVVLPLGSGPDDFIFVGIAIVAIGLLLAAIRIVVLRKRIWNIILSLFTYEKRKNK